MFKVFIETDPNLKCSTFTQDCVAAFGGLEKTEFPVDFKPARNGEVLHSSLHPKKLGLSVKMGQARLLHDLASIELQAMELALRNLAEFPDAQPEFREELYRLALSECEHFKLCLSGLADYGCSFGDWPVHLGLWSAVSASDTLLDRILIVHRYLEGSGLDSGETLQKRLRGIDQSPLHQISLQIVTEEVGHVEFGSRWYRSECQKQKLDATDDFKERFQLLKFKLPQRIEPIADSLRLKAGFNPAEIEFLKEQREAVIKKKYS